MSTLLKTIEKGYINSAHDCADGGLFITLLESAMPNDLGFKVVQESSVRKDAFLFGESQSRVVVSIDRAKKDQFEKMLSDHSQAFEFLGTIEGNAALIDGQNFGEIEILKEYFETALENRLH